MHCVHVWVTPQICLTFCYKLSPLGSSKIIKNNWKMNGKAIMGIGHFSQNLGGSERTWGKCIDGTGTSRLEEANPEECRKVGAVAGKSTSTGRSLQTLVGIVKDMGGH